MSAPWGKLRETGNAALDRQHRRMVDLFHELHAGAIADPKNPALSGQLDELVTLTESHFRDEEALIRLLPGWQERFSAHIGDHQVLLFELVKLRDEQRRRGAGIGPEVLEFLERWLYEHMATFDGELHELERLGSEPAPWLDPEP